jgi:hypothetical protein
MKAERDDVWTEDGDRLMVDRLQRRKVVFGNYLRYEGQDIFCRFAEWAWASSVTAH